MVGLWVEWMASVRESDARRIMERCRARCDDAVSGGHAAEELNLLQADRADPDGLAPGNVAVKHVRIAAALLVREITAIDHENIVQLRDEDAREHALALAQPLRLRAAEAQAGDHRAVDHLGGDAADITRPMLTVTFQVGFHSGGELVCLALGNLDLYFEGVQGHGRQQRRAAGDLRLIEHGDLARTPIHRGPDRQLLHLPAKLADALLLAIEEGLAAADVEAVLRRLRVVARLRLIESELRPLQRVLRAQHLQLRVGAEPIGLATAIELALRRAHVDLRLLIGAAQVRQLSRGVKLRALPRDPQAFGRGLLLLQAGAQVRIVDDGERLTAPDKVAGVHLQSHDSGSARVESRADRRYDLSVRFDVAHEIAARHGGEREGRAAERSLYAGESGYERDEQGERRRNTRARQDEPPPPPPERGLLEHPVLARAVAADSRYRACRALAHGA